MTAIVHSVEISRNPEDVFAALIDLPRFSEWQEGVVSAHREDDGPMKVGSKAKVTRLVGGRERTMTTELTDYSPPRSYAFRGIDGPIRPIGKGTVEPLADGARSRVTFELDFEGHGFGKLLLPFVRKQARKELPQNHENLKQRLENSP
jgi:carbon monoxide dehydrogenase subunit G